MPRPVLPLRTILRDEVVSPLVWAGVMALVVAFVLSLFIAGWIANPLQRMAAQTRSLNGENFTPLPLEGPAEVQQLAHSFNEMMERVQSSQQSQREFMANVSHELKTPLTSIQGFSQAILDGTLEKPEDLRQAGRVINEESGRMNRLVADLLALARLEAGTADLQRAPVNLRVLLTSVAEKFTFQSQAAQITLATDLKNAPVVAGDEDRLMQVFNNLVDNAIRFTPAGGKVTLGSEVTEGFALVKVVDTGVGIDPSEQQRIFDRFYQVDHARSGGAGRGVGLGLAIARQIVLAHQGKIWLESAVGQGTTFYVQLPLAAAEKNKR
jgi:two-component system OmpR family sensor kinase